MKKTTFGTLCAVAVALSSAVAQAQTADRSIYARKLGNAAGPNGAACTNGQTLTWNATTLWWVCTAPSSTPGADSVNGTELADTITLDAALVITADTAGETITIQAVDNNAAALTIEGSDGANLIVGGTLNGAETLVYGHATLDSHTFTTDGTGTAEVVLPNGSIGLAEIDPAACAATETLRVNAGATAWECVAAGTPGADSVNSGTVVNSSLEMADMDGTWVAAEAWSIAFDTAGETFTIQLLDGNAAAWTVENQGTGNDFLVVDTGVTDTITFGNGAAAFALASTGVDISTAGALSGVTDITLTGAIATATAVTTADLTATGTVDLGNGGATIDIGDGTDDITIDGEILGTNVLTFEGATDDGNNLTFAAEDPTANVTLTFADAGAAGAEGDASPAVAYSADAVAIGDGNAVWFEANAVAFEGATGGAANAFEQRITASDATIGDQVYNLPDLAAATTVYVAFSTLSSNAPAANNAVYFASNAIWFEGATGAGGNQVILQPGGDPGADVTLSLPTATGSLVGTGDTGTVTTGMILDDDVAAVDLADTLTADAAFVMTFDTAGETFTVNAIDNNAGAVVFQNNTGGADYLAFVTIDTDEQVVIGSAEVDAVIVTTDAWTTTDVGTDGDYDSFKLEVDAGTAGVFEIEAGADDMLLVSTDADAIAFGNDATNPGYTFHGTGTSLFDGAVTVTGTATTNGTFAANGTSNTIGNAVTDGLTVTAAVQGATALVLDGATDDGNVTNIAVPDVAVSQTISIPDASAVDTTTAFFLSTEAGNVPHAANSVWGGNSAIVWEGSGADGFETTLNVTNATAARTITLPDDGGTVALINNATQTFSGAETFTGAVTIADAGADAIQVGDALDTVTILGNIAITDTQWGVTAAGAANFGGGIDNTTIGAVSANSGAFTTLDTSGNVNISTDAGAGDTINIGASVDTINLAGNVAITDDGQWSVTSAGVAVFASVTMGTWTMANGETIDNATDDMIEFQGAGGGDNTDLRVDLDGTYPVIDSPTDASLGLAEDSVVFAAAGTHDLDTSAAGVWNLGRSTSGTVTVTASDDDATAAVIYDAGGAAAITVGSADVLGVNLLSTVNATTSTNTSITNGATGTVTLDFRDFVDTTDDDMSHVLLTANCTATGAGAEDCDFTIGVVEGGAAADTRINIDANGGIVVGSANTNTVELDTDGTGDAEIVLSDDSVGFAEVDDTATIGADPAFGANQAYFGTTGLIWEGTAADGNELLLTAPALGGDVTITLPSTTGTLVATGDSNTVSAGMIANPTDSVVLPIGVFLAVSGGSSAPLEFNDAVDTIPDFDTTGGLSIEYDVTGASVDSATFGTTFIVPARYTSGGLYQIRAQKSGHSGTAERIRCADNVNGAAVGAYQSQTTSGAANTLYTFGSTGSAYAAGASVHVVCYVDDGAGGTTHNETTYITGVEWSFTATQ